ncbi:hypothetical protein ABE042_04790 [Viridibacillus arvi]|uniref:hypothetical protein n=1 Tax=Viridibacillus arvi TaxID=263475 RepID=UPI003D2A3650
MAEQKPTVKTTKATEPTFSKQQLVKSRKYAMHRDVISALLNDEEQYTFAEVDKKINVFLKGEVKK